MMTGPDFDYNPVSCDSLTANQFKVTSVSFRSDDFKLAAAAGMLLQLHVNGKFAIGKFKSSLKYSSHLSLSVEPLNLNLNLASTLFSF